jgi:NAD(P)-dependent dehydrogenase (short-subunit alcohol dehydrogenase family)
MSSSQTPLGSGFGPGTTASDVVRGLDLSGTVAVVTGGYAGMGFEITKALTSAGVTVIAPARTPDKARKALASVEGVEVETLDLMNPSTIDGFVGRFLASGRPLHMLVNNAGINHQK